MDIKPRNSISDQVYEHLKTQILKDELHPGQHLAQERVAEELNISRMPVREALRLLEQDGLVERLPQGGLRVTLVTLETIKHVLGTRAALEEYAMDLACDQISDEEIAKLENIKYQAYDVLNQNSLNQSEKTKRFYDLNTQFHETIYEIADNPYLTKFIQQLRNLVLRMRAIGLRETSVWIQIWEEHAQILDSLKRKDKEAARCHIKQHIENAASYTTAVVRMEKFNSY